jgi:amino acid adenylation domain-containing protein
VDDGGSRGQGVAARVVVAGATVPQLIWSRAALDPQKSAVEYGSQRVSYRELVSGAGKIAARLREQGASRDTVVGIWLDRSPAMVYAALGVMRAGAAYLPLDPGHPPGRLWATLGNAATRIVLTDIEHLPHLEGTSFTTLLVEEVLGGPDAAPGRSADLDHCPDLSDLAYVVYTSGSTGRPKGVEITHASLLNLIRWHQAAFAVTDDDRASAIAGPGFDASVWELWPHLTAGATVTIARDETRLSMDALRDWLIDERVTICFLPTVLAEAAIAQEWPEDAPLRTMLTGGDALHVYPRDGLPFALVNNYGPAECTVVTTSGAIGRPAVADDRPSIGRPIANVQVHLLDGEMKPVPPGALGEIYVGGAGVARGYRNDAELTADRFVVDPFSDDAGARLYRTGDLARYRGDGTLEFRGRVDSQIQVRGNRVEPDEVAFHLEQHPDVRASCVIAAADDSGETQLAAYFVPSTGQIPTQRALAVFLRERVPDYMLPASFTSIAVLPLSPNGKIDRNAVVLLHEAARATNGAGTSEDARGPDPAEASSASERRLAELAGALLGVDGIGAEDDFFLLGGHSLLAAQLIARIREEFGTEISLRAIFDHPTIRELAVEIERSREASPADPIAADAPSGV